MDDAPDISAHRTRTNRRSDDEHRTPTPTTIAEINAAMADVVEDRD